MYARDLEDPAQTYRDGQTRHAASSLGLERLVTDRTATKMKRTWKRQTHVAAVHGTRGRGTHSFFVTCLLRVNVLFKTLTSVPGSIVGQLLKLTLIADSSIRENE